jgi:myo-inositol-1(or 4)-monophosphatase
VHPLVNIAVRAAREAGKVILRDLDRLDALEVSAKGRNDFVSEVDRRAEQAIIATVRRSYPDHAVLGEESGLQGVSDHVWVIDPLDGTTNYLHGFPVFSVSIAVRHRGRLEHAVVFDPLRNELFTASRGAGAQLNSRRIRVSKRPGLEGALLGTGFPYRDLGELDAYLRVFRELLSRTAGVRRAGSAALDLAYVACARLDGFWEVGLKEWDMAAGALLIQEAGGSVSDFAGGDGFLASGSVVGGGLRVHTAILEVVRRLAGTGPGAALPALGEIGEGGGPAPQEPGPEPAPAPAEPARAAALEPQPGRGRPTLGRRRSGGPAEEAGAGEPPAREVRVTRRPRVASRAGSPAGGRSAGPAEAAERPPTPAAGRSTRNPSTNRPRGPDQPDRRGSGKPAAGARRRVGPPGKPRRS